MHMHGNRVNIYILRSGLSVLFLFVILFPICFSLSLLLSVFSAFWNIHANVVSVSIYHWWIITICITTSNLIFHWYWLQNLALIGNTFHEFKKVFPPPQNCCKLFLPLSPHIICTQKWVKTWLWARPEVLYFRYINNMHIYSFVLQ